jgi:tetratricopeptide (TPR) repeat protein
MSPESAESKKLKFAAVWHVSGKTLQAAVWTVAATVIAYPYFRGRWMPPPNAATSAVESPAGKTATTSQSPAETYLTKSFEQYKLGRFQEAIDASMEALKLQPDMAMAYANIGACYGEMQLWDKAIENTQQAMRLDPAMNKTLQGNLDQMLQARSQQAITLAHSGGTVAARAGSGQR